MERKIRSFEEFNLRKRGLRLVTLETGLALIVLATMRLVTLETGLAMALLPASMRLVTLETGLALVNLVVMTLGEQ